MKKLFKRIYIEILNYCNLNCAFCNKTKKPIKIMNIEEFKHILNEIKPYTDYLYLHVQGEPLIHKDLKLFLIEAKKQEFEINITTNGTLLKENMYILDYCRQINISIQSFYNKANRNDYLERICELIDYNKKTYISLRLWGNFESQSIITFFENRYNQKVDAKLGYKLMDRVFFSFEEEFDWPSLSLPIQSNIGTCLGTISHIGILSDGTVVPCCLDKDGIIELGNIFTSSFTSIINSERFNLIKKNFKTNKIHEELCLKCSYRNKFNKNKTI